MTPRENILRAYRFEQPDHIPMSFHINAACWHHYAVAELEGLMAAHPLLFPGFKPGTMDRSQIAYAPYQRAGEPYTDPWGCVWETADDGITGAVVKHPLTRWDDFDTYEAPDPERYAGWSEVDWDQVAESMAKRKAAGQLCHAGLRHGHTYLTLTYIRGYENLTFDMCDEEPKLELLIGMVEAFNLHVVKRYLAMDLDIMGYAEDLGMQQGPMLSPAHFQRYIKPTYERLMAPAHEKGVIIHMHSDGHIMDLVDDMLDCGVDVLNLQDLVNGIDEIAKHIKGRVAIDLDVDRQNITRFGSPRDIKDLIHESVDKLGDKKGGLSMVYGLYPGVPFENVQALMGAMEHFAHYY